MCSCRNDAQSVQDEEDREGELLCLKIKAQLEDLFSSSHLAEDGFLLKHVQKNKQGYVSLKLLTCLKKVKRDGGGREGKKKARFHVLSVVFAFHQFE